MPKGTQNELLQDFSGGINNTSAPNRIGPNQLATARDCWYDTNAIRVRNYISNTAITVDSGIAINNWAAKAKVLNRAGTYYIFSAAQWTPVSGSVSTAPIYSTDGTTFNVVSYNTGTASTTSGSAVVTGSGTTWTNMRAGDFFRVNSRSQVVSIQSVDSDTQVTLTATYSTTNAGAAYSIYPAYGTVNGGNGCSFECINNLVYFSDATRTPGTWNGTTYAVSANFPKANFIHVFKNYMFAANTTANSSRVYWSAVKDGETWPGSNFIDVSPDDGQPITGLFNDGTSLIIIKKKSVYRLSGDIFDPSAPSYVLTKFYTPPECVFDSARSWTYFQGRYVLYGGFGLYEYTGGNFISRIKESDYLNASFTGSPWVTAAFVLEGTEGGQQAITYNGKLYLFSSSSQFICIEREGGFWIFGTNNNVINLWAPVILPTNTGDQLWAQYHNTGGGYGMTKLDVSTLGSETITPSFTTRVIEYKNQQRFGKAWLHFKRQSTGSITFGYKIDEGSTNNATVDMTTGTGNRIKSPPIIIGQVGQSIQFVISHSGSVEDFEVYAIEFERSELRQ